MRRSLKKNQNVLTENHLTLIERLQESYKELYTVHSDLPIVNVFQICLITLFLTLFVSGSVWELVADIMPCDV